ncbi:hypothetical protein Q7P37_004375 [Cladosporium fusiforme]
MPEVQTYYTIGVQAAGSTAACHPSAAALYSQDACPTRLQTIVAPRVRQPPRRITCDPAPLMTGPRLPGIRQRCDTARAVVLCSTWDFLDPNTVIQQPMCLLALSTSNGSRPASICAGQQREGAFALDACVHKSLGRIPGAGTANSGLLKLRSILVGGRKKAANELARRPAQHNSSAPTSTAAFKNSGPSHFEHPSRSRSYNTSRSAALSSHLSLDPPETATPLLTRHLAHDPVHMNTAMETTPSHTACHPRDKSSSPKTTTHGGEDILLDNYFDHSQQLDSTAFDALLDTAFETATDDDTTSTSTSTVKPSQQLLHTEGKPQQQPSSTRSKIALFNTDNNASPLERTSLNSPFAHTFPAPPSHAHSLPVNAMSNYHTMPTHAQQTNMYEQQSSMTQQPLHMRFNGLPNEPSSEQYYSVLSRMTGMGNYAPTMLQQQQLPAFEPTHHIEPRQTTADLLEYDNMIPEEDEMDETANGEVADPCYAQLLFRCLLEAPDHTMSLKEVYAWVCRHSQKARDSNGTGWQNSVRHNLSMNAAFERVTGSAAHGAKKGSLWRLTNRALQEGVISTTRYRKDPKRKPERRSAPAIKRQLSGAKGGQATRAASAARRAMQARASGGQHFSGIEQHRCGVRKHEEVYFTPTSVPTSMSASMQTANHPAASLQPGWLPHNMPPPPVPHPMSQPPSPYFVQPMEDDSFSAITHPSMSNPHTPNEVQVGYEGHAKAMPSPPAALGSPSRAFLTEFELSHLDNETKGLFGNHDEWLPDTPSLDTEGSFISEEMTPMTMDRLSVEPMRS